MIAAIISFFTDNIISIGISNLVLRFINFKKLKNSAKEIDDIDTIDRIKAIVKTSLSETKKTRQRQSDVVFLLLVKCPNSDLWEVTELSAKYKYLTRVIIALTLPSSYKEDSYYIRIQ